MPKSADRHEEQLRRYLLKLVPDDELDRIEDAYLATSDFEVLIGDAENRLVSDYVQGRLTEEERQAFESNYLVTKERREEVAIADGLRASAALEAAAGRPDTARRAVEDEHQGIWQRFLNWLRAPGPILGLAAAAAATLLLVTNVLTFVSWREQAQRNEIAEAQIRSLRASKDARATPVQAPRTLVIPALKIEETTLSQGRARRLSFRLPINLPEIIEIPLEIPQVTEGAAVDATLSSSGHVVWTHRAIQLRVAGRAHYADLQIPFAPLKPYLGQPLSLDIIERDHATLGTFQLSFDIQK